MTFINNISGVANCSNPTRSAESPKSQTTADSLNKNNEDNFKSSEQSDLDILRNEINNLKSELKSDSSAVYEKNDSVKKNLTTEIKSAVSAVAGLFTGVIIGEIEKNMDKPEVSEKNVSPAKEKLVLPKKENTALQENNQEPFDSYYSHGNEFRNLKHSIYYNYGDDLHTLRHSILDTLSS